MKPTIFTTAFFLIFLTFLTPLNAQNVGTLAGPINASGGISVDKDGYVYVADFGATLSNANGTTVYKIDPNDGTVTTFATGLSGASGNDFDNEGNFFQSNIAIGNITRITPDGTKTTYATGHSAPVGIITDDDGNVYVANCGDNRIRKISTLGITTVYAVSGLLACPNGLTIDDDGNLYTCNFDNGRVLKITPDGTVSVLVVMPGGNNGHLTYKNGHLYVVDRGGNRIYRVTLDGVATVLAGTGVRGNADGAANQATFSVPNGIRASVTGDTLYVNDAVPLFGTSLNPVFIRMIDMSEPTNVQVSALPVSNVPVLFQNVPNPMLDSGSISFYLPKAQVVSLKVYDVLGKEVAVLLNGFQHAGIQAIHVDVKGWESGIYFYHLKINDFWKTKSMVVK